MNGDAVPEGLRPNASMVELQISRRKACFFKISNFVGVLSIHSGSVVMSLSFTPKTPMSNMLSFLTTATSHFRTFVAFVAVLALPESGFGAAVLQITETGFAAPGGTIELTISIVETGGVPTVDADLETDGVFGFDFELTGFDSNFMFASFTPASPATPLSLIHI